MQDQTRRRLIAGALLAPLNDRSRAAWAATAAAVLAVLAYAAAPMTGIGNAGLVDFPILSLRYLVPALATCALAVAVTSRTGGRRAVLAGAVLAIALGWSLWRDVELGFPELPSVWTCLTGAGAGALAGLAAGWATELNRPLSLPRRPAMLVAVLLALGLGASLALPANGFVRRSRFPSTSPRSSTPAWPETACAARCTSCRATYRVPASAAAAGRCSPRPRQPSIASRSCA